MEKGHLIDLLDFIYGVNEHTKCGAGVETHNVCFVIVWQQSKMLDEFSKIVLVSLSSLHQRSFPFGWLAFAWVHLKYVYVSLNFLTLSVQFSMRSPKILRLTVLAMAKRCSRLFKIQFFDGLLRCLYSNAHTNAGGFQFIFSINWIEWGLLPNANLL